MDDLPKLPAEEAADQLNNEGSNNENTEETSDAAISLGDLSDVDTEVDEALVMLSPSLFAPLLQTGVEEDEPGPALNEVDLEAQSSSTDPFSSLFEGLVLTGQEEQQNQDAIQKDKEVVVDVFSKISLLPLGERDETPLPEVAVDTLVSPVKASDQALFGDVSVAEKSAEEEEVEEINRRKLVDIEEELDNAGSLNNNEGDVAESSIVIAPSSALDTNRAEISTDRREPSGTEPEELIIKETPSIEGIESSFEPLPQAPPQSSPPSSPPPPPPPQQLPLQQKKERKNKGNYPDIPGASLLELAEKAESRLAFGSADPKTTTSPTSSTAIESLESPFIAFNSAEWSREGGDGGVSQLSEIDGEEGQAFRKQLFIARLVSQLENISSEKEGLASSSTMTATEASKEPSSFQSSNTSMGTNLAARAFISPQLEPLFKRGGGSGGGASLSAPASAPTHSIPSVVAKYLGIVAVGTSAGTVHVLMPKAGGRGAPHLHDLQDRSTAGDAVTAIALGQHAGGLILFAGHASGQLRLWETKPVSGSGTASGIAGGTGGVTWVLARTIHGVHASAVTACTVIDGGTTTWALTADAHGRLMCHTVNRLLSITAQALAGFARQWAGGGAAAAAAAASNLVSLEAAGQDPGVVLSLAPLGNTSSTKNTTIPSGQSVSTSSQQKLLQQQQHAAKTLYAASEGSHFVLITATRAVLLAALSAEGSLTILHIFFPPPTPNEMQGETAGCAAWRLEDSCDSSHRTTITGILPGAQNAPHALVAIAWGNSVSIYRCALTRPSSKASPQASPSKATSKPTAVAASGGGAGAGSPPRPAATPLAPPQFLSTFSSEYLVNGLGFIGPLGALVVASAAGEVATEVTIYHPSSFFSKEESVDSQSRSGTGIADGSTEKLNISDWMVVRQLGIPGAASLHSSLATSSGGGGGGGGSDQLLLLTSRGVRVIHLLTWHQRLSTLVGMQKLEMAMLSAVRLYLQAAMITALPPPMMTAAATFPPRRKSALSGSFDASVGGVVTSSVSEGSLCLWPADGAAPSDAEEIARQLLTILHAFIDSKLHSLVAQTHQNELKKGTEDVLNGGHNHVDGFLEEEAEQVADIAVNTCLLLSRSEALFDEIAPKFLSSPFASAFLCQLEPRILADELPSLAPEVMQALVEHFAHSGQLERIEKCVLKLDILSLDLNQLIPLCLRHGLYGALIHIFIGALQDYQTPVTLLLIAAATADAASQQTQREQEGEVGIQLNHSAISSEISSTNKELLENNLALQLGYRLLVYLRGCLSGLQYPPGSGPAPPQQQQAMRLHAVTFLLHVNTAMLLDTWQLWASVAHLDDESGGGGGGVGTISSSHPSLTPSFSASSSSLPFILHDPSPVLRYLCQMDAPAVLGVLCAGLKGWDALESDLVDLSPELGPLILSSQNLSGNIGGRTITQAAVDAVVQLLLEKESEGILKSEEPALLKFVAEHLAAQRASAEDAVLLRVLRFLAEEKEGGDGTPAAVAASAAHGGKEANALSLAERESIFKDIVIHIHGNGSLNNNNNTIQKKNSQVRVEALDLARKAGFHQAEARIRHSERSFSQAFTCLIEDGARYPLAPFQYLRDICFDPGLTESDRNLVKSTALKLAPQLVRIDATETAAVVAECFSQESHVAILEALAPRPDDQFAFLQAAIEGSSSNSLKHGGDGKGISVSRSTSTRPMSPESTLESFRGDPLFAPLLNNKNVSSLYVRLLCRFQPHNVLPFLQAHDTYNVDECLKHCIDHGAREAAAFLLERKGDVQAALKMYLEQVDVANSAMVVAVKEKGVVGIPSYYYSVLSTTPGAQVKKMGRITRTSTTNNTTATHGFPFSASTSPLSPLPAAPPAPLLKEFLAARDAMNSAVSMCVRFAQDRMTPINSPSTCIEHQTQHKEEEGQEERRRKELLDRFDPGTTPGAAAAVKGEEEEEEYHVDFHGDPVCAVWFEVLQRYVTIIRNLRAEEKQEEKENTVSSIDRLSCLERIFTVFMEEVISQMAGHVPLHSIAAAVLNKYNKDSFGDFRATLSSLLGACNFELAILRCASRVTGTDTIALLKQGYKQCTMPQSVATTQQQQENVHSTKHVGGSGSGDGGSNKYASGGPMPMNAALRSLESAQQRGQEAWAAAAAAAGPAASKLMEKAGFA